MHFKTEKFPNGVGLAVANMAHLKSVAMGLWVKVGPINESELESGLSHSEEHERFQGTRRRSSGKLAQIFDRIGRVEAFTAIDKTGYGARVSKRHLPELTDVLFDVFLHSKFAPQNIARQKGVIIEEIMAARDNPHSLASLKMNEALWPNHPLGRPILGTPETVSSFTPDDFKSFNKRFYHGGNLWISLAGNIGFREARALMKPYIDQVPAGTPSVSTPVTAMPDKPQAFVDTKMDLQQTAFSLGLPGLSREHKLRYPAEILDSILGGGMSSCLFQNVREKHGLAYHISSSLRVYPDTGVLQIQGGVNDKRLMDALTCTVREMERLARNGPTPRELADTKSRMIEDFEISMENPGGQMSWMGDSMTLYGRIRDIKEESARMSAVTGREVRDSMRELLGSNKACLSVVGPIPTERQMLSLVSFR